MLFQPATNTQAFLKAGIMGFAGTGKTYTSALLAIGLVRLMKERGLPLAEKPVMFLDTETGSDWVAPTLKDAGLQLYTAKTRAFTDLKAAVREAEANASVLLIDSITHFWRELTDSYAKKKNRTRGLEFQDWTVLKQQWGEFTDAFVNSNLHIIMAGRAGYEYDFFENDSGKRELQKTGVKMKAETETGYEPSLLILMDRDMDLETRTVYRTAHVLKDRSTRLDGKSFRNPKFADFLPHVEFLNLGGQQLGVDTTRTSEDLFTRDGKMAWQYREEQREIVLDLIKSLFIKHGQDGTSAEAKRFRVMALEHHFKTASWREVESFALPALRAGYASLYEALEGRPLVPEVPEGQPQADSAPEGPETPAEPPPAEAPPRAVVVGDVVTAGGGSGGSGGSGEPTPAERAAAIAKRARDKEGAQ